MSQCIRTGAVVYLEPYGEFVRTDLRKTDTVYHFWVESEQHCTYNINEVERVNLIVLQCEDPRRVGREVVVSEDWCSDFDYEGKKMLTSLREVYKRR